MIGLVDCNNTTHWDELMKVYTDEGAARRDGMAKTKFNRPQTG